MGEAVLICTHKLCFEQKFKKQNQISTENSHFYNFKNHNATEVTNLLHVLQHDVFHV